MLFSTSLTLIFVIATISLIVRYREKGQDHQTVSDKLLKLSDAADRALQSTVDVQIEEQLTLLEEDAAA